MNSNSIRFPSSLGSLFLKKILYDSKKLFNQKKKIFFTHNLINREAWVYFVENILPCWCICGTERPAGQILHLLLSVTVIGICALEKEKIQENCREKIRGLITKYVSNWQCFHRKIYKRMHIYHKDAWKRRWAVHNFAKFGGGVKDKDVPKSLKV